MAKQNENLITAFDAKFPNGTPQALQWVTEWINENRALMQAVVIEGVVIEIEKFNSELRPNSKLIFIDSSTAKVSRTRIFERLGNLIDA